jgi:hypothetical protein
VEQTALYVVRGRRYCFYFDGWHGPGWYRCGFAWRQGLGWGGVYVGRAGITARRRAGSVAAASASARAAAASETEIRSARAAAAAARRARARPCAIDRPFAAKPPAEPARIAAAELPEAAALREAEHLPEAVELAEAVGPAVAVKAAAEAAADNELDRK